MKKSIVLCCLFLVSVITVAQDWFGKVGLNMSNWTGDSHGDIRFGYKAGVGTEYHFTEMWSLQSALFFTTKGVKNAPAYDKFLGKQDVNQMYLEIPVYGAMRFNVSEYSFTDIVISFGPYIACGVGGKTKGDFYIDPVNYETRKVNSFHSDRLKRFDAGLGFGVATEFDRIIVGLEAQLGLVKLMDHLDKPRNLNFSIMLGYKLWE